MSRNDDRKKAEFIAAVREKLQKLYSYGSSDVPQKEELTHQIQGFFSAGILLRVITNKELEVIIDEEHMKAFGKTKKQRRIEEKIEPKTEPDWSRYETPAYQRK